MAFLNSSVSFTRFKVTDEIPAGLWNEIPDRLRRFAFQDIDELPEDRAYGWTSFEDMLDVAWSRNPPQKGGDYMAFSLRLETRRVPPAVLKKHLGLALQKEGEELRKINKTFVARERKKELKEQVLLRLKKRFLPVPAEFQVIWNTARNEIWVASIQRKVLDLFQEFFTQSFELELEQLTPYSLAAEFLDGAALDRLNNIESTDFYRI
ncbi:MAG: recombination-associated protein RdgC [Deltaproteobacteria bacterium]|jgi:DNA recombination-dependent growth factor C|nr:recombination-associated protein RdgC [Deltaproteobacteria bacterium]